MGKKTIDELCDDFEKHAVHPFFETEGILERVKAPTGLRGFFGIEPAGNAEKREATLARQEALRPKAQEAASALVQRLEELGCDRKLAQDVTIKSMNAVDGFSPEAAQLACEYLRDFCNKVEAAHRATYDAWARERLIRMAAQDVGNNIGAGTKVKIT